jgi:hypothetical protein
VSRIKRITATSSFSQKSARRAIFSSRKHWPFGLRRPANLSGNVYSRSKRSLLPSHYTSAQLYVHVPARLEAHSWGNTVSLFFLKHEESGIKTRFAGCSKRSRGEAREKSTSDGVLFSTSKRGDQAERSIWIFFSNLLEDGGFNGRIGPPATASVSRRL